MIGGGQDTHYLRRGLCQFAHRTDSFLLQPAAEASKAAPSAPMICGSSGSSVSFIRCVLNSTRLWLTGSTRELGWSGPSLSERVSAAGENLLGVRPHDGSLRFHRALAVTNTTGTVGIHLQRRKPTLGRWTFLFLALDRGVSCLRQCNTNPE